MVRFDPNFSSIAAAFYWYTAGFRVVPLRPKTELPAVDRDPWLDALSATALASHWTQHADHEVGCVLGDELVVIEATDSESVAAVVALEEEYGLRPSLIIASGAAEQHFYGWTPDLENEQLLAPLRLRINIKARHVVVVLPPSLGTTVARCESESIDEFVRASREFLEAVQRLTADTSRIESQVGHSPAGPALRQVVGEVLDSNNPLQPYSLTGFSDHLVADAAKQRLLLGKLFLAGQAAACFGPPNGGKTLLLLFLLVEAIKSGRVDPALVYYVNLDDNLAGLVDKLRLAEEFGFNVVAEGHRDFQARDLLRVLKELIARDQARGVVIIVDTLKKVVDVMSKRRSTAFGRLYRAFILKGGTIVFLGHTNKRPSQDGRPIYAGTSDVVEDVDCAYTLRVVSEPGARERVVEFENIKRRGDVCQRAIYAYSGEDSLSYEELFASVRMIDDCEVVELQQAEERRPDAELIEAMRICLTDGVKTRMRIAIAVSQKTGCSRRTALKVLDRYTGADLRTHPWTFDVRARGAKVYRLHDTVDPQGESERNTGLGG